MLIERIWAANDLRNFQYLVACSETGEALVIDPLEGRQCLEAARARGFTTRQILNTHEHLDHTAGNEVVVEETRARVLAHAGAASRIGGVDRGLGRGDIIKVFAAGLGQTSPAAVTNRAGIRDQNVLGTVISGINNEGVRTVSARAMEGAVGVYIVEMEIPENATTGDSRPLAIAIAGPDGALVFANGSAIPIQ